VNETTEEMFREFLVFELENQRYGLPLRDVMETVRAVTITPLPQAPSIVEGVINFRGMVVPVFDIRARFGHPPRAMQVQNHLILASAGKRQVALRVDRAMDLVRVRDQDVQEAQTVVPHAPYISGVARLPDGLMLIHDLATFLSEAETETLSQSLSAHERAPS
jgi:purine-binding chemotaxis protein CheW